MSIVLHIDTAVQTSSICLAREGKAVETRINPTQKDAAAWLHVAIQDVLTAHQLTPGDLEAIAVSAGPGSYTGLRVGMSAAKGLCYALGIPLITINTLEQMAAAAGNQEDAWLCPMIDARRMEVFTALYDPCGKEHLEPTNLILDEKSFEKQLEKQRIFFFGNGSEKFRKVVSHQHACFGAIETHAGHMLDLTMKKLQNKDFSDLAYAEPNYGKAFHSIVKES